MVSRGRRAVMASGIVLLLTACIGQIDPTPLVAPVARAEATRNGIGQSADLAVELVVFVSPVGR